MQVTLSSTTRLVEVNGAPCRVWEGTTEGGIRCYAAIAVISAHKDDDQSEFRRSLGEHRLPSNTALDAIPLRLVL